MVNATFEGNGKVLQLFKNINNKQVCKKTKQNKNNKKNMLIDKILEEVVIHS